MDDRIKKYEEEMGFKKCYVEEQEFSEGHIRQKEENEKFKNELASVGIKEWIDISPEIVNYGAKIETHPEWRLIEIVSDPWIKGNNIIKIMEKESVRNNLTKEIDEPTTNVFIRSNIENSIEEVYNFFRNKMNSYDFMTDFIFESESYFGFKYYAGYSVLELDDVTDDFISDLKSKFSSLYNNEKIHTDLPKDALLFEQPYKLDPSWIKDDMFFCITVLGMFLFDFVVKRKDGKIIDWKYIDINNFHVFLPNYVLYWDELDGSRDYTETFYFGPEDQKELQLKWYGENPHGV